MWAQDYLSGLERGQDPAYFNAGTEMGAQEYVFGDLTRARPRLVRCSDPDMCSGVFSGGLSKCYSQLVQCRERYVGSGVYVRVLSKGTTRRISVQGWRGRFRSVCWGCEKEQDSA